MHTLASPEDTTEILRRLRRLRPDSTRRWGRMSPHQAVCHLADSFRFAMGEKAASPAITLLSQTVVKWIALYVPLAWPAGIPTRPEVSQEGGGTKPTEFDADVAQLEALVERFTTQADITEGHLHPFFGRMSRPAWLRWGYLHTDHHLRQFGV